MTLHETTCFTCHCHQVCRLVDCIVCDCLSACVDAVSARLRVHVEELSAESMRIQDSPRRRCLCN